MDLHPVLKGLWDKTPWRRRELGIQKAEKDFSKHTNGAGTFEVLSHHGDELSIPGTFNEHVNTLAAAHEQLERRVERLEAVVLGMGTALCITVVALVWTGIYLEEKIDGKTTSAVQEVPVLQRAED